MNRRFTLDGGTELETRLANLCIRVLQAVHALIPTDKLQALVLGGGYGRGQGGVLKTDAGELPYNDFEFYVFLRGNRILNERRYGAGLNHLGETLSEEQRHVPDAPAELHVEFKLDSLEAFRRRPVSMFSYDLVAGHRIVFGDNSLFAGCAAHCNPENIPLSESTRLLFNRCTGLLLARERLSHVPFSEEDSDFVGRNLAKAQLAFGDAVLAAFRRYHWSCPERHERLGQLFNSRKLDGELAGLGEQIIRHHGQGVEFKLHPRRIQKAAGQFVNAHSELCSLAMQLWLWVESRRLERGFASVSDYATAEIRKCPETAAWRNCLLNLRTFGARAALDSAKWLYPRERLLNALPLLLWDAELRNESGTLRHLQRQLQTCASDWSSLVTAYTNIWRAYG